MDIATVIGLGFGSAILAAAIILGGNVGLFVDIPSVLIVFGGIISTAFIRFGMSDVINSIQVALKTFFVKMSVPSEVIQEIVTLANIARKNGLIALEQQPINDPFLKKGIMYCVDGHEATLVEEILKKEVTLTVDRHETGQAVFRGMGDSGPAFGMIGTLVGLVQMLANMSDAAAVGPAMAVALLTTLYGSSSRFEITH